MTSKTKILVVDDELGPRESLRMILKDDYEVETAANGKQAINCLEQIEYDLAILDIRMPDVNGIELLENIKENKPATEVIMITAYASIDTATKALRSGALDYLIKPFDYNTVRDIVKRGISRRIQTEEEKNRIKDLQIAKESLEKEIEKHYNNIQTHYKETVASLVAAVDAKDSYTKGHQERVAKTVWGIGKKIGMEEESLGLLYQAAKLHDIGKIGVPEQILRKPGSLNKEEDSLIKKHSKIGAEILSPVKYLKELIPFVLYHHERYDGSGYPEGLCGSEIPLGARIIAIADAIDAMLWERPYAPAKTIPEVKEELKQVSSSQIDPELVKIVLDENILSIYY